MLSYREADILDRVNFINGYFEATPWSRISYMAKPAHIPVEVEYYTRNSIQYSINACAMAVGFKLLPSQDLMYEIGSQDNVGVVTLSAIKRLVDAMNRKEFEATYSSAMDTFRIDFKYFPSRVAKSHL